MRRVLTGVVLTLLAAGCSGGQAESSPLVTYPVDERSNVLAAELRGELVLEDGCLMVDSDDGGVRYAVIFPDTARWEDGHLVYGDTRYEPGDPVDFGGGESGTVASSTLPMPDGCPDDLRRWAVGP